MSQLPEPLRKDIKDLQAAINSAVEAPSVELVLIDRIYAQLHNSKVQGEERNFSLVSNICALACGILQRTRSPDEASWRAIKAHIDALVIVVDHDVVGDGGDLGKRMVGELSGLAKAVGG